MTKTGSRRGHGEGSIFQRKDGLWAGTVEVGRGLNGKRRRKAFYGQTRKEVAEKVRLALAALDKGATLASDRRTMAEYLGDWLKSIEGTVRQRTHERYEQLMRVNAVPFIGSVRLTQLTPQHLRTLYAERLAAGLAPRTVGHLHGALHKALRQAADDQILPRNVASLVKRPQAERHEMKTFSPDEARAFIDSVAGGRDAALYVMAVTTGMRQGELLALKWRDVDLDARKVQVRATLHYQTSRGFVFNEPKTAKSRRLVTLTEIAAAALRQHRTRQLEERLARGATWRDLDLVFTDEFGGPMNPEAVTHRFQTHLKRVKLPLIRFHDLRHTAATLMLSRAVHPKIVSEMLGHATVAITLDTYSHVTPTMQREAAAAMDAVLAP